MFLLCKSMNTIAPEIVDTMVVYGVTTEHPYVCMYVCTEDVSTLLGGEVGTN